MARLLAALIIVIAIALPASTQSDLAFLKREYKITAEKLKAHSDGFSIHDGSAYEALLEREWQIWEDWVAASLNQHSDAPVEQITKAFVNLDPEIGGSAILLAPSTYLVTMNRGEIGTVFVVVDDAPTSAEHSYRVRWTIREIPSDFEDELSAWLARKAVDTCREKDDAHCGPLYSDAVSLPPTADGRARFYIDAGYAQGAGATIGKQLSIWEWDGQKPKPLIVKSFSFMIDQSHGIEMKGDVLHIYEKAYFHSFFSCGSCEERQLDWRIRITPTSTTDLGERSLVPELDALDSIIIKLAHGESAENDASDQVVELLSDYVMYRKEEIATWSKDKDYFSLGMLSHTSVTRDGGDTILCFSTDDVGPLKFRMQPKGEGFFIQNAEDTSDNHDACAGPGRGIPSPALNHTPQ